MALPTTEELYSNIMKRLEGGDTTLKSNLADIEAGKSQAVSAGQANLIRGGLSGTTVMGAVPLAAEKTAARARLAARGASEDKYLSILSNFAQLAESSEQAKASRQSSERIALLGAQSAERRAGLPVGGTTTSPVMTYGGTFGASSFPDMFNPFGTSNTPVSGANYAQQFPSLYGQTGGGSLPSIPDWTGGGGESIWSPPREYDPSMVGKSMWGQMGSQVPSTLEQRTQTAVSAGLPESAQGDSSGQEQIRVKNNRTGQIETAWHDVGTPIKLAPGYSLA